MSKKDLWVKDIQEKVEEKQEGEKPTKKVKDWDAKKASIVTAAMAILSYSPPSGLFSQGAETIAQQLKKDSKDLKQAMSRLNFYINRAGGNLPAERRKVLEKAKEVLRGLY